MDSLINGIEEAYKEYEEHKNEHPGYVQLNAKTARMLLSYFKPVMPKGTDEFHLFCARCNKRIRRNVKPRFCYKCGAKIDWKGYFKKLHENSDKIDQNGSNLSEEVIYI